MANIREVAKLAGVAVATVSRYMNGTAKVAPKTQEKIEAAMKELDYIPNELARSMFKKRANTIGMLVPNIQHPWFATLASEIEKELFRRNYKLMLFSTAGDKEREKECLNILKSNIADGVICGTSSCEKEDYASFHDKPLVMLDYKINDRIPLVVSDHVQGGIMAAQVLSKAGCKNVIHISSDFMTDDVYSFQSHSVLDTELKKRGIASRFVPIRWDDFDFQGYYELARVLLSEYPEIDGIMAADLPATAFIKAAQSLGKRIPEDLSIISYDGTYILDMHPLKITCIRQSFQDIGKTAVRVLLNEIDDIEQDLPNGQVLIPVELIDGETVKHRK